MGAYRPQLLAALAELRREFDFQVYPVVPNAPAYVRDLADLVDWVRAQSAVDGFEQARQELVSRGLAA